MQYVLETPMSFHTPFYFFLFIFFNPDLENTQIKLHTGSFTYSVALKIIIQIVTNFISLSADEFKSVKQKFRLKMHMHNF